MCMFVYFTIHYYNNYLYLNSKYINLYVLLSKLKALKAHAKLLILMHSSN